MTFTVKPSRKPDFWALVEGKPKPTPAPKPSRKPKSPRSKGGKPSKGKKS